MHFYFLIYEELRNDQTSQNNLMHLHFFVHSGFTNGSRSYKIAYHGTNSRNLASIAKQGLLVGGRGCARVHGAAYGAGVYCSPYLSVAKGYSGGDHSPIFVCAVSNYRNYGSIWVAPSENHVCVSLLEFVLWISVDCEYVDSSLFCAYEIRQHVIVV